MLTPRPSRRPIPALLLLGLIATPAAAEVPGWAPLVQSRLGGLAPGLQCRQAIRAAERAAAIPEQLMAAIGRVESGRRGPDGQVHPWPWSINAEGTDITRETKADAIATVRALQAKGVRSIDVGCMQVNLLHHPTAFASLEQAFDPTANAQYAARFLRQLYAETGDWTRATARYHSANPELGDPYQRRVAAVWPDEKRTGTGFQIPALAGSGAPLPGMAQSGQPLGVWSVVGRGGPGPVMLSNRAENARVLPMAGGGGRDLSAYRAAPIPVAGLRPPARGPAGG